MKIDKSRFCLITLKIYYSITHLQNQHHKCCIWKVSFLHELLLHVYSNYFYQKNSYHKSCSSVASNTNTALERFLSFMNCFHIFIQIAFIWKTLITKIVVQSSITYTALKRFLAFMNYFYMIFQIVLSEILELKLIHLFNIFIVQK